MNINFPLILVIAVFVTAIVAIFDWSVLAKKRRQALALIKQQFSGVDLNEEKKKVAYETACSAASQEPVVVEYSKSFFPVLAIVLILRSFIVEPFQIPSESMVPTLEVGDFILVNKFAYGIRLPVIRTKVININQPERGDVMVFFPPHETRYFIKRVIGLPGDTVKIDRGDLYINGSPVEQKLKESEDVLEFDKVCYGLNEHYEVFDETFGDTTHEIRKCSVPGQLSQRGEWTVPDGHYFMMGDNRDNSSDSRAWERYGVTATVPEDRIVGKAFGIWMHWEKLMSLPSFSRVGKIQ